jgi:NADH:ubiquinone oxidoreductase subunit
VEVVPLALGDQTVAGLRVDSEELIATRLIEDALRYTRGSLANLIRNEWADEFDSPKHYRLIQLPKTVAGPHSTLFHNAYSSRRQFHALTVAGVALVLLKTDKEIGRRLRAALVESEFMQAAARATMNGGPAPYTDTLPGDVPPYVQTLLQRMGDVVALLAENSQRIERNERAILYNARASTTERPPNWYVCDMTAVDVADHLAHTFPVFRNNPRLVHNLTGRSGLRGPDGASPVPHFSEQRRDHTGYHCWFYSPACVRTLHDTARGLGYYASEPGPGGSR